MENKEQEKKHVVVKNHVKQNHVKPTGGKRPAIPTKPRLTNRIVATNAQINTPSDVPRAIIVPDGNSTHITSNSTGGRTRGNHISKNQSSNSSASNAIVPPPSYAVVSNTERDIQRELCDMMRQSLRVRIYTDGESKFCRVQMKRLFT